MTLVTPKWVEVEVEQESWRFTAGTLLLLRRSALLEMGRELISPDAAIVRVYPPQVQSQDFAARVMDRLLRPPMAGQGDEED